MTVSVRPRASAGSASGNRTLPRIWRGVAPMASAASISPRSTSRSAASTRRAKNGIAATASGTIAAPVPIEVPTARRVKGMIATIRMMNGVERVALTNAPRPRLSAGWRHSPGSVVANSTTPSKVPSSSATSDATPTISSVSSRLSKSCSKSASDMAQHLHTEFEGFEMGDHRLDCARDLDLHHAVGPALDVVDRAREDVEVDIEAPHQLGDHRRLGIRAGEGDAQDRPAARHRRGGEAVAEQLVELQLRLEPAGDLLR